MEQFPVVRIRYDPQDNQVEIALADLLASIAAPGTGTVTSVSVVSTNGVSGSVANPTTTPAISLSLGAITPSSVTTTLVTGLAAPTAAADAANKGYVDSVVAGLTFIPPGARVATTGALTATYNNGTLGVGATLTNSTTQAALTIDGVLTVVADVVLVKNQAAPAQNGIYTVTTVGTGATNWVLTRATNYDQLAEIVAGSYTAVGAGTVNAATLWIMTGSTPITVGTTAIPWTQLNVTGAGSVTSVATGTGLTGGPITTTGTVSIANGGVGTTQLADVGVTTGKVADGAISYAKFQNVAAVSILGNPTGSPAAASEITLGSGLAFVGATLTATGTGGTVTSVSVVTANGISGTVATATTTPAITLAIANSSIVLAKLANLAGVSLLGNPTGSPAAPSAITLGTGLSFSGTTLQATGSGGTVTSIATGAGLTGGTITASGTIAFAAIADQRILANVSGGSLAPSATTASAVLDIVGSTQGDLLYRDSSVWGVLAPGTSGYLLATQGAAANPHWIAPLSIFPSGTAGQVLTTDGATPSFSSKTLKVDQHFGAIAVDSIVATTATFNLALNDWHTLTLDHTATTTLAVSNATVGQMFVLRLIQDGTGSCLVNWFSTINWRGGGMPVLSTDAGAVDVIAFKCISAGVYDGYSTVGGGLGTVTSVSVTTANGFSGTVATATTTPAITISQAAGSITLAKLANASAHTLIGNPTGSAAAPSEITLGAGLSFSSTTLVATGSGGTVTTMSIVSANGVSGTVATATTTPAVTLVLGAITPSSVNASGTLAGSNFSGSSSGANTGDQTITLSGAVAGTGTGAISTTFAPITGPRLLANASSSGTAAPGAVTLSAFLDGALASTQGDIMYRGASTWDALAPGTAGQVLKTAGAAANPVWASTGISINQHIGIITTDTPGSTITFDLSVTDWHSVTLGAGSGAGNSTLALSNPTTGQQFTIRLVQDGTGSRTVTWFSGIKWPGGTVPTLSTAINKIDVFTFKCTGSGAYDGFTCGLALA